jgi:hypothetical protein
MGSFLAVTGPKDDLWLVRTVGLLIAIAGASMLTAARGPEPAAPTLVLAVGCALGLAAVDVRYTASGTIPPIYLADAVVEMALASALLWAVIRRRRRA